MNKMQISNHEIQVKEYNSQRVVTFKDIDLVHQHGAGSAKKNFFVNKIHFREGKDFYFITRKEFSNRWLPNEKLIGNPNVNIIILTESGYLMLAKTFTDDLAWRVQRELVNCYFKIQQIKEVVREAASDELTVDHWIQLADIISRTPTTRMKYQEIILRRLCPEEFGVNFTPNHKKVDDDIGRRIAEALQASGMMQKDLAELLDCAKSTISHYISGKSKPRGKQLQRIVEILKIVY